MRHLILAAALLATPAFAEPAEEQRTTGADTLVVTALIGQSAPGLSGARKALLLAYIEGRAKAGPVIRVRADSVQCRSSNVDITHHACTLKFGARTVTLAGCRAHELHVSLAEIGVPREAAMGSVYVQADAISCVVTPIELVDRAGGGVACTWTPVTGGER